MIKVKVGGSVEQMPLLFLHLLWLWKDSDHLLGGGGGVYATVLPASPMVTHSQTHPWLKIETQAAHTFYSSYQGVTLFPTQGINVTWPRDLTSVEEVSYTSINGACMTPSGHLSTQLQSPPAAVQWNTKSVGRLTCQVIMNHIPTIHAAPHSLWMKGCMEGTPLSDCWCNVKSSFFSQVNTKHFERWI